jgi:outer membrane protein insertion porin family
VLILPVNSIDGPHQDLRSLESPVPVEIRQVFSSRSRTGKSLLGRMLLLLLLALTAGAALAQTSETIESIRVIGNRRIPKETILARLFTHQNDTYDPISIERDFNSLWNTGYFEDLRIEREDSEKGIILNVIVREKPTIREIKYNGLNAVSQSDVLDGF